MIHFKYKVQLTIHYTNTKSWGGCQEEQTKEKILSVELITLFYNFWQNPANNFLFLDYHDTRALFQKDRYYIVRVQRDRMRGETNIRTE